MVASCPSLCCSGRKKMRLMQRSRGFGRGVVFSKICYRTVIVLSVVLCDSCKPMNNCWDWAFSSATVGWKCGCQPFSCPRSQNVTHCWKEICSTCLFQESIPAIPFWNCKHPEYNPCQKQVPESGSTFQPLCLKLASCPTRCCSCRKKPVSCREAEKLVTELWSPRLVTMQWLCSQLFYVTAANRWTIVEIELLATVGWKWGCQPFSCPCSQNVTHCRMEICSTCLSKESIPAIPGIHSLPEASGSWEPQCVPPALHYGCIMPIPLLQLRKKPLSCREVEVLVTELWSPRFVTIQWLCSQSCYLTAANQRTIVEIELLATVGWKWGCQPFSCPCLEHMTHSRKEICATCLFKESIPAITFGNSKHPLSARSRFLRAAVPSTSPAFAHAFVAAAERNQSHAEKQRVWSRSCFLQDLLQNSDSALSCAMWLLQTNEQVLRLSF